MSQTFVDVVGYTLEKVHTGVISWLLDTRSGALAPTARAQLLEQITSGAVNSTDVKLVKAHREYSPAGRRKRIDLVLEIAVKDDATIWWVAEFKTDADFDAHQLESSWSAVDGANVGKVLPPAAFTLGTSQVTLDLDGVSPSGFTYDAFDVSRVIDLFRDVEVKEHAHIHADWIQALQAELRRIIRVEDNLVQFGGLSGPTESLWRNAGYRPGIPLYTLVYDRIRLGLRKFDATVTWRIYSGINNPVMNLADSWTSRSLNQYGVQLYLEFNWDRFVLKASIKDAPQAAVELVRQRGRALGNSVTIEGASSSTRSAKEYISIYRWSLPLGEGLLDETAQRVHAIVAETQHELAGLATF